MVFFSALSFNDPDQPHLVPPPTPTGLRDLLSSARSLCCFLPAVLGVADLQENVELLILSHRLTFRLDFTVIQPYDLGSWLDLVSICRSAFSSDSGDVKGGCGPIPTMEAGHRVSIGSLSLRDWLDLAAP